MPLVNANAASLLSAMPLGVAVSCALISLEKAETSNAADALCTSVLLNFIEVFLTLIIFVLDRSTPDQDSS